MPMRKFILAALGAVLLAGARVPAAPAFAQATAGRQGPDDVIMFVGTYTKAPSKGIYAYRFNATTGAATPLGTDGLVAETENPSFLAVHPNHRFLYAVNEISKYEGKN